jgi:hypothetical protein
MPSMTNAERQRRYRERRQMQIEGGETEASRLLQENALLKSALANMRKFDRDGGLSSLTEQQSFQRAAMIADLLSDRPWWRRSRKTPVTFMGHTRDDWLSPWMSELAAHFGLTPIVAQARRKRDLDLEKNAKRADRRLRADVSRFI